MFYLPQIYTFVNDSVLAQSGEFNYEESSHTLAINLASVAT